MIRVKRPADSPPSLTQKGRRGRLRGTTEESAIIAAYAEYCAQPKENEKDKEKGFQFPFAAYKADDVRDALSLLFRGKCAYCESRYAVTQPMDVEHWRPKGGVEVEDADGKTRLEPGYPWLAARWSNLLPSCIDCNRPRLQTYRLPDGGEEKNRLGKANQFPITGERMGPPKPGDATPPAEDTPLLIDPTTENPAKHLSFRDDGLVMGLTEKGRESIRVYALNRAELVVERLALARLIEQRLTTIEALAAIIADPDLDVDLSYDLQDLAANEIDALLDLADPTRPFSAMAQQLIDENAPLEITQTPAPVSWPPDVAAMLQRFVAWSLRAKEPNPRRKHFRNHEIVASRLSGLGFSPSLAVRRTATPTTARTYLRWTVLGQVRLVTLYQNGLGLVSDSKTQLPFAEKLDGAERLTGRHPKVLFTYQQTKLDGVLAATTRFHAWADGRDDVDPQTTPRSAAQREEDG